MSKINPNFPSVIPSVWTPGQRDMAVLSPWPIVHVAGGRLRMIEEFAKPLIAAQKTLWVHPDMIAGLAKDPEGLDVINELLMPDAIVTSNLALVHMVKKLQKKLVFRVFVHDTQSLESSLTVIDRLKPNIVCCLPAIVFPFIRSELVARNIQIVAAGLVRTADTRDRLIELGASVELGNVHLW